MDASTTLPAKISTDEMLALLSASKTDNFVDRCDTREEGGQAGVAERREALGSRGGAKLIGVNNRDLRTFEVSLETSLSLAREAPSDALLISESGLKTSDDLQRLRDAGYRGFLIGETLMRADDPAAALRSFRGLK